MKDIPVDYELDLTHFLSFLRLYVLPTQVVDSHRQLHRSYIIFY